MTLMYGIGPTVTLAIYFTKFSFAKVRFKGIFAGGRCPLGFVRVARIRGIAGCTLKCSERMGAWNNETYQKRILP
ncbi:hypothetical protein [Methanoregula sp.]|uniref:hypothetical protein n=1 Tax=Methanoregula sp. TaxID=2052170 RepID=UPI003562F190